MVKALKMVFGCGCCALPPPLLWTECFCETARATYYHHALGLSIWEHPAVAAARGTVAALQQLLPMPTAAVGPPAAAAASTPI